MPKYPYLAITGKGPLTLRFHNAFSNAQFYIVDVFLKVMSSELYLLRWLDLTGCKCLNNELVNAVFENNPNLETVDLSECQHLTSACLQKLAVSAKKLKRYIRDFTKYLFFCLRNVKT